VIGAGPFGVSISAHLHEAAVEHRVLGEPMGAWAAMPKGMCLRSPARASSLSDPAGAFTLEAFHAERGTALETPVRLDAFIDYGHWFIERTGVEVERRTVTSLERGEEGFVAALADGESIAARRVVLAAGTQAFRWLPPEFRDLPAERVSHASDHRDLGVFAGQELVVVGRGQSGIECAALAHEHGANVRVLLRGAAIHWLLRSARLHSAPLLSTLLYAPSDVGPAGLSRIVDLPGFFRLLPDDWRTKASNRCSRPAAAAWLERRTETIPFETGHPISAVRVEGDRVRIERGGAGALVADHLLLATGYRVDISRYSFLTPELLAQIECAGGYPLLRRGFESSVAGLHIVGWPAIGTFGPLMRHVSGTPYCARALTRALEPTGRPGRRARQYHFEPERYTATVAANVPHYSELQSAVAEATRGVEARTILDLGIGTGETTAAVLAVHPGARITGVDSSLKMLEVARSRLPATNVSELVVRRLQDPLPSGEFDVVVTALAVHHLTSRQKRDLFTRVRGRLSPGSVFVLADVVRPAKPEDALTPTSRRHDRPERAGDLERWLADAGFDVSRTWTNHDLVVFRARANGVHHEPAR
jgi:SAM-dependent methyltransferase